jgi:hypothetical protein
VAVPDALLSAVKNALLSARSQKNSGGPRGCALGQPGSLRAAKARAAGGVCLPSGSAKPATAVGGGASGAADNKHSGQCVICCISCCSSGALLPPLPSSPKLTLVAPCAVQISAQLPKACGDAVARATLGHKASTAMANKAAQTKLRR